MKASEFILKNVDLDFNLDLIHVPDEVDLSEVDVEKVTRSGEGYVYPDSIYYEPLSGSFVEFVTLD